MLRKTKNTCERREMLRKTRNAAKDEITSNLTPTLSINHWRRFYSNPFTEVGLTSPYYYLVGIKKAAVARQLLRKLATLCGLCLFQPGHQQAHFLTCGFSSIDGGNNLSAVHHCNAVGKPHDLIQFG
jgi:hypothetical protein